MSGMQGRILRMVLAGGETVSIRASAMRKNHVSRAIEASAA